MTPSLELLSKEQKENEGVIPTTHIPSQREETTDAPLRTPTTLQFSPKEALDTITQEPSAKGLSTVVDQRSETKSTESPTEVLSSSDDRRSETKGTEPPTVTTTKKPHPFHRLPSPYSHSDPRFMDVTVRHFEGDEEVPYSLFDDCELYRYHLMNRVHLSRQ